MLDADPVEPDDPPRKVERDVDELAWQRAAACRTADPAVFFGAPGERPEPRVAREAYALSAFCSGCPVRDDCVDYARRHREYGIWGETEHERVRSGNAPEMPIGTSAKLATLVRRGVVAR